MGTKMAVPFANIFMARIPPTRFGGKSYGRPDFKRKNNNKAESFFD